MPTIIDSLIVKLGLDSKDFSTGQAKVEQGLKKTSKEAEVASKSVAQFLAVIGGIYGIKKFVEGVIETSASLERMSKNLGMSANDLSAWSRAAELAGGSGKGLQGTFDMLSKAQTELMLTGESDLIPYFSALGISMASAGQARPVADMLIDLADKFSGMDRRTAFNMGQMMGIDEGTMNLLLRGRAEVELMIKRQKEQGAVTKKQAEESERMREKTVKLKQEFEAFGRELISKSVPALEWLVEKFQAFSKWVSENQEFVILFLKGVAAGLIAIGLAVTPINLTVAAVIALGAAIALLKQDYDTWKRGGESLIDWSKWGPGIDYAIKGIKTLAMSIKAVSVGLASFINLVTAMATGDRALYLEVVKDMKEVGTDFKEIFYPTKKPEVFIPPAPPSRGATSIGGEPDRKTFVNEAARLLGTSPEIIDAHLRLETGATGKSAIGAYNYGNIKGGGSWIGDTESRDVLEYNADGTTRTDKGAKFRSYTDPTAAAEDYANLIKRKYQGAVGAKSAAEFAKALKAGGYATDPGYVGKLTSIAAGIPGASGAAAGVSPSGPAASKNINSTVQTTIGEVTINTQATDAQGIANSMHGALYNALTPQMSMGLF